MVLLESPYTRDEVTTKGHPWWHFILIFPIFFSDPQWNSYLHSLERQMRDRGSIPKEIWGSDDKYKIANEIENIFRKEVWHKRFVFHPNDRFDIVSGYDYGDGTELEAMLSIECKYNIYLDVGHIEYLCETAGTFGDFIDYIVSTLDAR